MSVVNIFNIFLIRRFCQFISPIYCPIYDNMKKTRCTRGVRVVFSVTRMRSSNSARMNKFDFTTEKIGSVHRTVFEIVASRNVDNWIQLLT